MVTITLQGDEVKTTIPEALYMAIIRIQGRENLDFVDACMRLAKLADINSEAFEKGVQERANKFVNSRLMSQLNKGRETIRSKAWDVGYNTGQTVGYDEGHKIGYDSGKEDGNDEGHKVGYDEGSKKFKYPCSICGGPISLTETEWVNAKLYLRGAGWGHGACHSKT